MRVISFGIYSKAPEYPRHSNLIRGLIERGIEVVECHFSMAATFDDRMRAVRTLSGAAHYILSLAASYASLSWQYLRAPRAEVILIGYPGYFHVPLARVLRRLTKRRPAIAYDVFFSLYDSLVHDRKLLRAEHLLSRVIHRLETLACRCADVCLIDTNAHADYLSREFRIDRTKARPVYVGSAVAPASEPKRRSDAGALSVLFVGTYIPLHGVEVILEAATVLRGETDIRFELVGKGQLRGEIERLAGDRELSNVTFRDWVSPVDLCDHIRSFDIALGIFGTTPKAARVIPTKVFDICAAGVSLVTADTPAIREAFRHGDNAYLVPPGDGAALAAALRKLRGDVALCDRLAAGAHETYLRLFSIQRIGGQIEEILRGAERDARP